MFRAVRVLLSTMLGAILLLGLTAVSWAKTEATVIVTHNKEYGNILTDSSGRSLYIFSHDKQHESTCYGSCAQTWQPFVLKSGQPVAGKGVTAKLGTITRKDGSRQVTANGMPLYYFAGDKKPGDTNGQAVNKVWWLVSPSGQPVKSEAAGKLIPKHAPATGAGGMATRGSALPSLAIALLLLTTAAGVLGLRRAH
ncbi:Secreted repeat of unknown function [Thermobaculum terrenum ATCC BAA-798]|uniref:Lipoprotein n=1 Tax=Thermobaculum terrenum (strain ATCC BAA-798 / CCMEE 7001 / YNP1) TaxID=525904 RepID=D1CGX8_THET1|nr:hypothetical protein [Thermobaculum terrenum]ACZ42999.1 Secreted repeat of unknown function [Thermobaculum terrenum ATCC BAA-798]